MQHKYVSRQALETKLQDYLRESPIVVLLGARQTGKTTLARHFAESLDQVHYFDLERTTDRAALSATPELTLSALRGTVVIDEIQRLPSLFEILRPLSDRPGQPARFVLLGSASPNLIKGASESLAGRVLFLDVPGFSLQEIGKTNLNRLWLRGSFPRSFLASDEESSFRWREAFVQTFLERDIPQLGIRIPSETLRRFWTMLAHYHGQIWNAAELARSLGVSQPTARRYLDILCDSYVLRALPPWFENLKKRQVKSPKVYIRDSGILHYFQNIVTHSQLVGHPVYGASWEGFALEQTLDVFGQRNVHYWRTQRGAELDLLVFHNGKRIGFEFKCTDAPTMTRSMHVALEDLNLNRLYVIYPGEKSWPLHEKVQVLPLFQLETGKKALEPV
jgi:predicted AAA+ superfamily ATPase